MGQDVIARPTAKGGWPVRVSPARPTSSCLARSRAAMFSTRHPLAAALCCSLAVACAPASTDRIESGIEIQPAAPQVPPAETVTFSATVGGAAVSVTWSVQEGPSGGSVTASGGLYTAPSTTGTFHVIATTASGVSGTATVTVIAAPVVQVTVAPGATSVVAGGSVSFSATVTGTTNPGVSWAVQEGSAGGGISSTGVYTAPSTPGTYHVVATSVADGSRSGTATVTVTAPNPVSVVVSPGSASVVVGGTVTFSAAVSNTANTAVTWAVSESACGTITSGGVYTAPSSAGTCHVVATSVADSSRSDTVTVTVTAPPADLAAQLAVLAGRSYFFAHNSTGGNILTGLQVLLTANSGSEPVISGTSSPANMNPGVFAHAGLPSNGAPATKIANFESALATGIGAKVDVAIMKFCFDDFWASVPYFADGGTPETLFAAYQAANQRIHAAYPGLVVVHFTAPLWIANSSNTRREAFNQLLRNAYGGVEPVFDLALHESTRPDGTRERDGSGVPALVPAYTDDGGHLNATGADRVAKALVAFLAGL